MSARAAKHAGEARYVLHRTAEHGPSMVKHGHGRGQVALSASPHIWDACVAATAVREDGDGGFACAVGRVLSAVGCCQRPVRLWLLPAPGSTVRADATTLCATVTRAQMTSPGVPREIRELKNPGNGNNQGFITCKVRLS